MKAKLPLIIVIVIVIILIAVDIFLGGDKNNGNNGDNGKINDQSLKDVEISSEIYGFSAEIKGIKDKTLTLEASILTTDESANPVKTTVRALVVDNTRIVKLSFPEEVPTDLDEPVYPEETELSFGELKVGDKIDVGAVNNVSENIKNGTEFELSHIFIIE